MKRLARRTPTPATCRLGWGELAHVGADLHRLGGRSALLVTSPGLAESGTVRETTSHLVDAGLSILGFDATSRSPDRAQVEDALERYRSNNCDSLVSVGGGNAHDLAKLVGVAAEHGPDQFDNLQGVDRLRFRNPPHVAVNTTTGSGAELTRFAFVTSHRRGRRMMFCDERLTPRVAINDPATQISQPSALTAVAGMNLLTHAIEAYLARSATPLTDVLSLDAIELLAEHLPRAVESPLDEEARTALAQAEQMAGLAYNSAGLGLADAVSLGITAVYDAPHAAINGILLPHVLAYESFLAPDRVAEVATVLTGGVLAGDVRERAKAAPGVVESFAAGLRVPRSLRELGVGEEVIYLCRRAVMDSPLLDHARRRPSEADVGAWLDDAVEGRPPSATLTRGAGLARP